MSNLRVKWVGDFGFRIPDFGFWISDGGSNRSQSWNADRHIHPFAIEHLRCPSFSTKDQKINPVAFP
jgi:elongation factor P hydroxylase